MTSVQYSTVYKSLPISLLRARPSASRLTQLRAVNRSFAMPHAHRTEPRLSYELYGSASEARQTAVSAALVVSFSRLALRPKLAGERVETFAPSRHGRSSRHADASGLRSRK